MMTRRMKDVMNMKNMEMNRGDRLDNDNID